MYKKFTITKLLQYHIVLRTYKRPRNSAYSAWMSCVYFGSEYTISKDQELYEFFSKHFRQKNLASSQKRLFRTDLNDLLKAAATGAHNAPNFLMCVGIIILSDGCVGIRSKTLSSFIGYKSCVIRKALKTMQWTSIAPTHHLCPAFVQKIPLVRQWAFYTIPSDSSVAQIILTYPNIVSKEEPKSKLTVASNPVRNLLLSFA